MNKKDDHAKAAEEALNEAEVSVEEALLNEEDVSEGASEDGAANEIDAEPTLESMAAEIAALRSDNEGLLDKFVRAKAETDNTRRISSKEVEKARKFALESFSKELLSVKDSLDQAAQVDLQSGENAALVQQMSEGLALTLKQLDNIFERFKIEIIQPESGDVLDTELHQAMTMQASDEVNSNHIISTIQVGYTLNQRLLRPAMVIVSSGA